MGQRTAFLIKRTFWDGTTNIRLEHHQWGIGRVMHNNFIRAVFEMLTNRGYDKSLKDFMTIMEDDSLYMERTFRKGSIATPDVFNKRVIQRYFDRTDNNNGGMIIEIKEKQKDSKPWSLDIEDLKIAFVLGHEECKFNYDTYEYLSEKPFENLYTGEEYVRISCDGRYAYPEFIQMWNGFIKQYEIEEISDTKESKKVA